MSAKLTINGVEITVPTAELGEAMRQLAPLLEQKRPQAQVMEPETKVKAGPGRPRRQLLAGSPEIDLDSAARSRAISLLRLLSDHALSGGATVPEVMRALEADHPKGTGSRMVRINRLLTEAGFEPSTVYNNSERDAEGARKWTPGPKLKAALARLMDLEIAS